MQETRTEGEMENWENEYPEVDAAGRRFRRVGNVIEYEPELNGQPRHVFAMSRDRQKSQAQERYRREQADALARQTGKTCPFRRMQGRAATACQRDCAFYGADACVFRGREAVIGARGGDFCPLAGKCAERCALYEGGCALMIGRLN